MKVMDTSYHCCTIMLVNSGSQDGKLEGAVCRPIELICYDTQKLMNPRERLVRKMKNIYFDLCAIPIYMLILFTYYSRKMNRYREFQMYYLMCITSLVCAVLDIAMELVVSAPPLTMVQAAVGMGISFTYKVVRNVGLILYLLFIVAVTRTEYNLSSAKQRMMLWTPNAIVVFLLLQNFFTGNVFSVTMERGYARGPLLIVCYVVALVYMVVGLCYTIACKPVLDTQKWIALLSVYAVTAVAVVVQLILPMLMVEMFSTAIGLLIVMILVVRPEEKIDNSVGAENWSAFQMDLRNMLMTKHKFCLFVFHMQDAIEKRNHLGDQAYSKFVSDVLDAIYYFTKIHKLDHQLYIEQPENFYLITTDKGEEYGEMAEQCVTFVNDYLTERSDTSVGFHPLVCVIRCPEDLRNYDSVINLCHRFPVIGPNDQRIRLAAEFVNTDEFAVLDHIDQILENAIAGKGLEMYYQPIYDTSEKRFCSAEALARIHDPRYGLISPLTFIPAAEKSGLIIPLGAAIVESVFRFISQNPLESLGLSYIEINLSVMQCRQKELPEIVSRLQKKYGVSPEQINFEVTESIMGAVDMVLEQNLERLSEMGYCFSLDDYGTGYSNLHRLRRLPLSLVKIDKSMVDDILTADGSIIMKNTIQMMQGINKRLVVEGVETKEVLTALEQLSCDYIQGYYFSRPLPEEDFITFLRARNDIPESTEEYVG